MSERTTVQMPSTNGHAPAEVDAAPSAGASKHSRGVSSMVVPLILIVTALVVLRRMQRGNYA
jgi:hypothetical protein